MKTKLSTLLWVLVAGIGIGAALTSWIAPRIISWYFDPPAGIGVSCKLPIDWALARMQRSQFIGSMVGGAIALVVYFVWFLRPKSQATNDSPFDPNQS